MAEFGYDRNENRGNFPSASLPGFCTQAANRTNSPNGEEIRTVCVSLELQDELTTESADFLPQQSRANQGVCEPFLPILDFQLPGLS